jgi:hypothetical protein
VNRLSIVIPHTGDSERLETTLLSVLENRPEACEVLVVLSDVYNDPYDLAAENEVTFIYAPIGTDLIRCINLGIDASQAPIVHLLTPGMTVVPGWSEVAMARLDRDPMVTSVAPVVCDVEDSQTILSQGLDYSAGGAVVNVTGEKATILGPSRYAAFYRKSALSILDRFDVELGEAAADMDLALKLQAIGGQTATEPMCRVCFDRFMQRRPVGLRATRAMEQLFWRWASRKGWIRSLVSHLGQVVFDTLIQFPKLSILSSTFGRLIGLVSIGNHRLSAKKFDVATRQMARDHSSGPSARKVA